MQYRAQKFGNAFVATIEDDAGKVLDTSQSFAKKTGAMALRDRASAAGVRAFADIGKDMPKADAAFAAFDHNGDGKPGGSLPKSKRVRARRAVKPTVKPPAKKKR